MYSKEFVNLCCNWIKGKEQDKSKFEPYYELMKKNSIRTTGFRIWGFNGEELNDVLFEQGDLSIDKNTIESCFSIHEDDLVNPFSGKTQHIENTIINGVQKWISPYIDDFRIITRWANEDYFKPYEVLKYGMKEFENNNIEYTQEDYDKYKKTYDFYKNQNEILFLGKYDNISSDEIIYLMVSKYLLDTYDIEEFKDVIYDELEEYYLFYNNEETREVLYNSNFKLEFKALYNFKSYDFDLLD